MKTTNPGNMALKAFLFLSIFMSLLFFNALEKGWAANNPPVLLRASEIAFDLSDPNDPTIVRTRAVIINKGVLPGASGDSGISTGNRFTLNLFDDVAFTVAVDSVQPNPSGTITLTGHLEGLDYSSVTFVLNGENLVANIHSLEGTYQIRFLEDGTQLVHEIDPTRFPPELEPIPVNPASESKGARNFKPSVDDGSQIDVLVVYTPSARAAAGGTTAMQTLIDLAVSETNTAYANSGVIQRINLVQKEEVNYVESGFSASLVEVTDTNDGNIDSVHTLRDATAADEVVLIINNINSCGLAWLMSVVGPSFATNGFSVVHYGCATGNFSFGHELGHNMAARHDWGSDPTDNSPFAFNHGYTDVPNSFRTIMGTVSSCSTCTRIQNFANPLVNSSASFGSAPTGVAVGNTNPADVKQTFDQTRATVAQFRDSATRAQHLSFTSNPSANPGSVSGGGMVSLGATATDNFGHTATITYSWVASCAGLGSNGSFDDNTLQNPTWTAPPNLSDSNQTCSLTVTADDGLGATQSASVNVTVQTAFSVPSSQRVVSPYWQADAATYSFMSISHPSLSGMSSQIGVVMTAQFNSGSAAAGDEFTILNGGTQKVFIIQTGGPLSPAAVASLQTSQGALVEVLSNTGDTKGNLIFTPKARDVMTLLGPAGTPGRGFPDITSLSFWGAIIIANSTTGFAMEFIGDEQDSRTVNTANVSGLN